jgi:HK97 family phage portal protein
VATAIDAAVAARTWGPELDPWQLPVVVACRGLIADTIAQLPLVTLQGRRALPVQPMLTIRPNPLEPRWLTIHRMANNLTRYGYTWLVVTDTDAAGNPAAVRVVDPSDAAAVFDPVTGDLDTVTYNGDELAPGLDVVWIPFRVERRGSLGTSPLVDAAQAVAYLAQLWTMAGSFWEAGYPSLVVKVKHRLNPGQATQIKEQLITSMGGRHEPGVIDQDGDIGPVGVSPLEAQLVESIGVANAEIARAFLMPPSLVNVASGDSLTYSTVEGEFRRWLATGLGAYLNRFESAFNDLTPPALTTRFDTTELVRADFAARVEAYAGILAGQAWMSVDEVRDLEGLDPLDQAATAAPTTTTLTDAPPGA